MLKRYKVLIAIVFVIIASIITLKIKYSSPDKLADPCNLSDIETGDLIISKGHSLKSDIVNFLNNNSSNNSEYSHIGIFVRMGNTINIVHMSLDNGYITTESLEEYINNNVVVSYDIFKTKEIENRERLYSIIDSLRVIKKPFDKSFEMDTEDSYYCTEFIYKALLKAGINKIKEISYDKYLYPHDFTKSNIFYKVNITY